MRRFTRRSLGAARSGSLDLWGLAASLASSLKHLTLGFGFALSSAPDPGGKGSRRGGVCWKDNGSEVQMVGRMEQHKQAKRDPAESREVQPGRLGSAGQKGLYAGLKH